MPVAFSAGFTPHPRLSYLGAAPTGAASEAEYLTIRLSERRDPAALAQALDAALPRDLRVLAAVEWPGDDLPGRLEASAWRLVFADLPGPVLDAAVDRLLAAASWVVTRGDGIPGAARDPARGPAKPARLVEVRPAIVDLTRQAAAVDGSHGYPDTCAILSVILRHSTPAVRPDDLTTALAEASDGAVPSPLEVTRLSQGMLQKLDGVTTVVNPF
jgi:hypothetical protein